MLVTSVSSRNQALFWVGMNIFLLKRLNCKLWKDHLKSHCLQLVGKCALDLSLVHCPHVHLVHCPQLIACVLEVLSPKSHLAFTIMVPVLTKKMSKYSQDWCLCYDLEGRQVRMCCLWCCRSILGCNAFLSTPARNSIWTLIAASLFWSVAWQQNIYAVISFSNLSTFCGWIYPNFSDLNIFCLVKRTAKA